MNITIRIPGKIDPDLSPNARIHHMRRARAVKAARELGYYYAAVSADDGTGDLFRYDVTIGLAKGEKHKDDDNAAAMLKAYRDGIADGLGADNDHHFQAGSVEQVRDPEGVGFVEFRFTDISDTEAA